jgi:hypothetical protein
MITEVFLIWWLTQEDCEAIGEPHDTSEWSVEERETIPEGFIPGWYRLELSPWPDYLKEEYRSRYGRAGRGRLWVPAGIPIMSVLIPDDHPLTSRIDRSGGILFHERDLIFVKDLPGMITTLRLDLVKEVA